jgi:hypothetical protein
VQTIRNQLKACCFKSRRPHKGMELTVLYKRQRHALANKHMRRNWRTVLFSEESRFPLEFADGRIRIWRRPGERFAEACVMPVDRFGSGRLMVWGGMHYAGKTNLIVIRQALNAQRYCCGAVHAQKQSVFLSVGQCSDTHRWSIHEPFTDQQC